MSDSRSEEAPEMQFGHGSIFLPTYLPIRCQHMTQQVCVYECVQLTWASAHIQDRWVALIQLEHGTIVLESDKGVLLSIQMTTDFPSHFAEVTRMKIVLQLLPSIHKPEIRYPEL
jgi:hypothetical protein